MRPPDYDVDLLVIGGGINGAGIARDAAGRGLKVLLAEARDLAVATSSASSKLIHGGLRYLEHYEFRLVRESLTEREVLWDAAKHIIWPLRFVLPIHSGLRPAWLLRLGLFLYDHIGGRRKLPPTRSLRRGRDAALLPLGGSFSRAFEYSDCWVDDARLVLANALDAAEHGAMIKLGWRVSGARREGDHWLASLSGADGEESVVKARAMVNAAGPWVEQVLQLTGINHRQSVRLIKGSHIVVPRLYDGEQAYTLQNEDGRVVFIIPYLDRYSLIGTTDIPYDQDPAMVVASAEEIAYLCRTASEYLATPIAADQVLWSYSGVRPLYDDGSDNASAVTRDYNLVIDQPAGQAPLLSIFGGKITTFRKLAEHALAELLPLIDGPLKTWTAGARLPGGRFDGSFEDFLAQCRRRYPEISASLIYRLCRAYGDRIELVLQGGLGAEIAPGLHEAELRHMRDHEWARNADDALWRRSKLGVGMSAQDRDRVADWFGSS